jgi:hypothetical protein
MIAVRNFIRGEADLPGAQEIKVNYISENHIELQYGILHDKVINLIL